MDRVLTRLEQRQKLLVAYHLPEMDAVDNEMRTELASALSLSLFSLNQATRGACEVILVVPRGHADRLPPVACNVHEYDASVNPMGIVSVLGTFATLVVPPHAIFNKNVCDICLELLRLPVQVPPRDLPVIRWLTPHPHSERSSCGPYLVEARDVTRNEHWKPVWVEFGSAAVSAETPLILQETGMHLCDDVRTMAMVLYAVQHISSLSQRTPIPPPTDSIGHSRHSRHSISYYPILLRGRGDREAHVETMRRELEPTGAPFEVITAVDGATELCGAALSALVEKGFLSPPFSDEFVPGRRLVVNNVAAFLSHVRAIERVAADLEAAEAEGRHVVGAVLEDDVVFVGGGERFHDLLVRTADAVWSRPFVETEDKSTVVQMYLMPNQVMKLYPMTMQSAPTSESEHCIMRSPEGTWGMQCYLMRSEGARKLLEGFRTLRGAVDEQISRIPGLDLRCLSGPPALIEDVFGAPSVTGSLPRYVDEILGASSLKRDCS